MRRAIWLTFVFVVVLVAAACTSVGGHSVPTPTAPPVPGSLDPPVFYRAMSWIQDGVPASFVPNEPVLLMYYQDNGQMTVMTGCGSLTGHSVFDGINLRLTNVSRNRTMEDDAFCTDTDKHQDDVMAAFFTSAPHYSMSGSNLDLTADRMTLNFVAGH